MKDFWGFQVYGFVASMLSGLQDSGIRCLVCWKGELYRRKADERTVQDVPSQGSPRGEHRQCLASSTHPS